MIYRGCVRAGGICLAEPVRKRSSGWVTRDYKEDGSSIELRAKDIDVVFVYLVVMLCVLIAVGGISESEMRLKPSGYTIRVAATAVIGIIIIGILVYQTYVSMQVRRVRIDSRGVLFTIGKQLRTKIPWKELTSVRCYEREGGFTMGKTIRGIEFVGRNSPKSSSAIFSRKRDVMRMESDVYGQESLEKTIRVVRYYLTKHKFEAKLDEWEKVDMFIFSDGTKI